MKDLTSLHPRLDPKKRQCRAIIETPKGSRSKFDYDTESDLFMLGGLLPEGMMFPFDFGFIPSTVGGDGDPLDILVLLDAPAHVGCLVDVRLIGVIQAEQSQDGETEENDRLVGVAVHSYEHENIRHIDDANPSMLKQIEAFFVSYNKQRNKKFTIKDVCGPKQAVKLVEKTMKDFKKRKKGKRG